MRKPTFQDPEINRFFTDWQSEMDRIKRDSLSSVTANRAVLLYSPSKKVYEIKVDDSGVISATLVSTG
jgi:hypothetical protein